MQPYEILVIKTEYDENDKEVITVIVGPKLIFAYTKDEATKKAVIISGVSTDAISDHDFYVREY